MYMHELKEKLCEELKEIARKGELGAGDLEIVHKLTDTIKNLDKIEMLEEHGDYSRLVTGRPICAAPMDEAPATVAGNGIPWAGIAGMDACIPAPMLKNT